MKSSNRRASRGGGNFRDEAEEYDAAITNLADFAREIIDKVNARLANTPREERWIKRMATALDLRAMAFPTGAVANSLASVAALVAADIVSIAAVGLTTGARIQVTLPAQSISVSSHLISSDQIPSHRMRSESDISDPTQCHAILSHLLLWIQVRVSEAGEPELWWAAGVGGPATGAGGHGVIIVYDAWPLHGHVNITTSRACFNSCGQTLLDVDELATWQWRRADVPPVAPPPALQPPAAPPLAVPMVPRPPAAVAAHAVTAAANASAVADAAAAAALLGGDAAATATHAAIFKVAWQVSQQGITARTAFDALLLLSDWMATRFDARPAAAQPAAPPIAPAPSPRPMPGIVVLWAQRCLLQRRLQEAAVAYPYIRKWSGASGTVIMEDIFTNDRFRKERKRG